MAPTKFRFSPRAVGRLLAAALPLTTLPGALNGVHAIPVAGEDVATVDANATAITPAGAEIHNPPPAEAEEATRIPSEIQNPEDSQTSGEPEFDIPEDSQIPDDAQIPDGFKTPEDMDDIPEEFLKNNVTTNFTVSDLLNSADDETTANFTMTDPDGTVYPWYITSAADDDFGSFEFFNDLDLDEEDYDESAVDDGTETESTDDIATQYAALARHHKDHHHHHHHHDYKDHRIGELKNGSCNKEGCHDCIKLCTVPWSIFCFWWECISIACRRCNVAMPDLSKPGDKGHGPLQI